MKKILILMAAVVLLAACHRQESGEPELRRQVTLSTTEGDIVLELYNETPLHRDNFLRIVEQGTLDSLLFHRVIENFMIQGGDLTSKYAQPGEFVGDSSMDNMVPAEIVYPQLFHKRGVLAAAREGDDVNPEQASSETQFYIVWGKTYDSDSLLSRFDTVIPQRSHGRHTFDPQLREYYRTHPGTPSLDGSYTVFGEVVRGLEVVGAIQCVSTDTNDRPLKDVRILKAEVTR